MTNEKDSKKHQKSQNNIMLILVGQVGIDLTEVRKNTCFFVSHGFTGQVLCGQLEGFLTLLFKDVRWALCFGVENPYENLHITNHYHHRPRPPVFASVK